MVFHVILLVEDKNKQNARMETNSTGMWLYAGGVNLILRDVRFGTVSLDWVTFFPSHSS